MLVFVKVSRKADRLEIPMVSSSNLALGKYLGGMRWLVYLMGIRMEPVMVLEGSNHTLLGKLYQSVRNNFVSLHQHGPDLLLSNHTFEIFRDY